MIPGSKGEAKESKPDWPILHVDPKWKERILDIVPARNLLVLMEKEYDVKRDAVLEFLYFFCRPLNRKAVSAVNREILRRKRQVVTITGQIQRLRQSILKAQKEREQPFYARRRADDWRRVRDDGDVESQSRTVRERSQSDVSEARTGPQ